MTLSSVKRCDPDEATLHASAHVDDHQLPIYFRAAGV